MYFSFQLLNFGKKKVFLVQMESIISFLSAPKKVKKDKKKNLVSLTQISTFDQKKKKFPGTRRKSKRKG